MKKLKIHNKLTNRETGSFKQYLKDVAEIECFSPEEETVCALKASLGDKDAVHELVTRNLRFVVSVAKQYASATNLLEDLVNEGNIGLIMAAEKFKPEMGFRFISYAVWWIRKIIMEHLSKNGRMVRLPANKINSLSKLDKKINELEQKLGREVDIQEVIDEFSDLSKAEDFNLLDVLGSYSMTSIDKEITSDGNLTMADFLTDDTTFKAADQMVIDGDIKNEISKILNTLKPRDKRIIIALYGLDGNTPMSLKDVGEEIGITREMIRQIKEKTLLTLKNRLKNSNIRTYQ